MKGRTNRRLCRNFLTSIGLVGLLVFGMSCAVLQAGQSAARPSRRNGGPISLFWDNMPLVDALEMLSARCDTPILLDRRVDPGIRISLEGRGVSPGRLLNQLATDQQLELFTGNQFWYLGPPPARQRLVTLIHLVRQQVAALPPRPRRDWMTPRRVTWPRLSEPRAVVTGRCAEARVDVTNADAIPHDLWRAGALPSLPLHDTLVVLLYGFEQTIEISESGRRLQVIPLNDEHQWTGFYSLQVGPIEDATRVGDRWRVDAPLKRHQALVSRWQASDPEGAPRDAADDSGLRASPLTPPTDRFDERTRFTLQVIDQPLEAVLNAIASRTGKQLVWKVEDRQRRQQRIRIDVRQVTLDELLTAACDGTGLKCVVRDSELVIQ